MGLLEILTLNKSTSQLERATVAKETAEAELKHAVAHSETILRDTPSDDPDRKKKLHAADLDVEHAERNLRVAIRLKASAEGDYAASVAADQRKAKAAEIAGFEKELEKWAVRGVRISGLLAELSESYAEWVRGAEDLTNRMDAAHVLPRDSENDRLILNGPALIKAWEGEKTRSKFPGHHTSIVHDAHFDGVADYSKRMSDLLSSKMREDLSR